MDNIIHINQDNIPDHTAEINGRTLRYKSTGQRTPCYPPHSKSMSGLPSCDGIIKVLETLEIKGLSPQLASCYSRLLWRAQQELRTFENKDSLANEFRLSYDTLNSRLDKLVSNKVIVIQKQPGSNAFRVGFLYWEDLERLEDDQIREFT